VNTQTTTPQLNKNIKSLFIEGRLWFDKINGNTYHAVRIQANGQVIGQVPMTYGYGDMWQYTALDWLKSKGLASQEVRSIYELRKHAEVYITATETLKRDLWKAETIDQQYSKLLFIEELKKAGAN
jgi:hypothetical protein